MAGLLKVAAAAVSAVALTSGHWFDPSTRRMINTTRLVTDGFGSFGFVLCTFGYIAEPVLVCFAAVPPLSIYYDGSESTCHCPAAVAGAGTDAG